jgi:hypothetical protein
VYLDGSLYLLIALPDFPFMLSYVRFQPLYMLLKMLLVFGFLVLQVLHQLLLVRMLGPQSVQVTLKPCVFLLETIDLRFQGGELLDISWRGSQMLGL